MIPTLGRIVHYRLTADEAEKINRRRENARYNMTMHEANATGAQIHVGNPVSEGEVVAAVIVKPWGHPDHRCNLKLLLDGNDDLWVGSAHEGTQLGDWFWPPREGEAAQPVAETVGVMGAPVPASAEGEPQEGSAG